MEITILGAGSWGIAQALLLHENGFKIRLWERNEKRRKMLRSIRRDPFRLPHVEIPPEILILPEPPLDETDWTVIAVASVSVEEAIDDIPPTKKGVIITSKGLSRSGKFLSEIVKEHMPKNTEVVVLSGPSHAEEVSRRMPTAVVAACPNLNYAEEVQKMYSNPYFRVYTTEDIRGVEFAGAFKNVIAIGCGICDGLNLGDNAKAAFMTRGLAEMIRFGKALGANPLTFAGLAGVGDLVVTCFSRHSRNRKFGELIARGMKASDALEEIGQVVEGYYTLPLVENLKNKMGVRAPITEELYNVIYKNASVQKTLEKLMMRELRHERS